MLRQGQRESKRGVRARGARRMEHAAVAIGTTADLEEMKVRRWREERPEQSLQSVHAPDTRSRGQRDLLAHIQVTDEEKVARSHV